MCLFKVYVEEGGSRRRVAEGIVVARDGGGAVELYDSNLRLVAKISNARITLVDTLNDVLVLKA